jgi:hypothetical protein
MSTVYNPGMVDMARGVLKKNVDGVPDNILHNSCRHFYIMPEAVEIQDESVPVGSPVGQNVPIGVQEQFGRSHLLSHTTEQTNPRQEEYNQHCPEKVVFVLIKEETGES